MQIDARGKGCPQPVMMVADALSMMNKGTIEVLVDNVEASMNVREYAGQNGMAIMQSREGKDWKVLITIK